MSGVGLEHHVLSALMAQKERLTFHLTNRETLQGRLKAQGRYEILVDNGQEELVLPKHEILSIRTDPAAPLELPPEVPHKPEDVRPTDIQAHLLNRAMARRTPVILHLITKQHLTGTVTGYDNYTILLSLRGGCAVLVYKHGITTVHMRTRPSIPKGKPHGPVSPEQPA